MIWMQFQYIFNERKVTDTKGIIRSGKSKKNYNIRIGQKERKNKLKKIVQQEPHLKLRVQSDAQEGLEVPAPVVIPVVLLLKTEHHMI